MDKPVIKKTVIIRAARQQVWEVFTNPVVTRRMGGEYVSDWTVGSSFGWKGSDGRLLTKGIILEILPAQKLKHDLLDMDHPGQLLSTITYEFVNDNGNTILNATEQLNYAMTEQELQDAANGWDSALAAVKHTAENNNN